VLKGSLITTAAALASALLFMSAADVARAAGSLKIVSPKNGAAVSSPFTVVIHFTAADPSQHGGTTPAPDPARADPPAGDTPAAGGAHHEHAHLIIDSPLPAPGTMIPMDSRHIHLMQGETKTTLELPPGRHTLQLIVTGHDHRVQAHAAQSARVTIDVR